MKRRPEGEAEDGAEPRAQESGAQQPEARRAEDRAADLGDVQAALQGDAAARESLALRHRERLRLYLLTMIGEQEVAEDLVQESLRRAFDKLPSLEDGARFRAWSTAITVNLCRDHLRVRVHEEADQAVVQARAVRHSALSSVLRKESAELLALALDRLPILFREALVLHHVERLGYREMAEITGVREGTLQVRCHRAKALLRRQLGAAFETLFGPEDSA